MHIDERFLDASAAAVDLRIPAELKPGVLRFLQLAGGMAEQVMGLPLSPGDEPGNVWHPVEPGE